MTNVPWPTLWHRPLCSLSLAVFLCHMPQMSHDVDICGLSCCTHLLVLYHKCYMSLSLVVVYVCCVCLHYVAIVTCSRPLCLLMLSAFICIFSHLSQLCLLPGWPRRCLIGKLLLGLKIGRPSVFLILVILGIFENFDWENVTVGNVWGQAVLFGICLIESVGKQNSWKNLGVI